VQSTQSEGPAVLSLQSEGPFTSDEGSLVLSEEEKQKRFKLQAISAVVALLVVIGIVVAIAVGMRGGRSDNSIDVEVSGLGKLRGNVVATAWGQPCNVSEFLGIPYAEAPTGANRFLPPLKHGPWSGIRDATKYGSACSQYDAQHKIAEGSAEDCLFLNVWTPSSATLEDPKPVYFWIHGGGFVVGSGADMSGSVLSSPLDVNGKRKSAGLVIVATNYRLGPLGFLQIQEIHSASLKRDGPGRATLGGMNGMMDQLMALQWTYDHIADFGGDASKITIGGVSAGSQSTCMHLHSPLSQSLFKKAGIKKAILESGDCTGPWGPTGYTKGAINRSNAYVDSVTKGVAHGSRLEKLQSIPLTTLSQDERLWCLLMNPSVDGLFLPKLPRDLPVYANLSVIIGSNSMDGMAAPGVGTRDGPLPWPLTGSAFNSTMTYWFGEAAAEVAAVYPFVSGTPGQNASDPVAPPHALRFLNATSDVEVGCPALWLTEKIHAAQGRAFLYHYLYNDRNVQWPFAWHGAEVKYVWATPDTTSQDNSLWMSEEERSVSAVMQAYWSSFIEGGHPELVGSANVAWPEFSPDTAVHLRLSSYQESANGFLDNKCKFWDSYRSRGCPQLQRLLNFGYGAAPDYWPPLPPCNATMPYSNLLV